MRRNRDALRALQRGFNLEIATTDVDELLAARCDGVIVASATPLDREHAQAALRAGAHVLMEKPMTVSLADALAVAATARECDRVLSMAHGWNYSSIACWATDVMAAERLGRPLWVVGRQASAITGLLSGRHAYGVIEIEGFAFEASPKTWRQPDAGGYMYGQLSHQLALALTLIDSAPREVFARLHTLKTGADIDAIVSVAFDNGAMGSFSGHGRLPWNTRYPLGLRIAGERGVMTLDPERERADVHLSDGTSTREFAMRSDEYVFTGAPPDLELDLRPGDDIYSNDGPTQFLIDVCAGRAAIDRAPASASVRSVAIIEAAWRSAREGCPIEVEAT